MLLLKARKINLKNYTIEVFDPKTEKMVPNPYDVARSIENILCANGQLTKQRLSMPDLLRNARLGVKIKNAGKEVLIDEAEYQLVKNSFEAFQNFGINEVELCKRIDEAEIVEVKEKKGPNKGK